MPIPKNPENFVVSLVDYNNPENNAFPTTPRQERSAENAFKARLELSAENASTERKRDLFPVKK